MSAESNVLHITEHDLFPEKEIVEDYSLTPRPMTRIFIWDNEGKLGVVENKWPPHFFDLPGGGLSDDESYEECAIRECMEEMGATVTDLEPIATCDVWAHIEGLYFDITFFSAQLIALGQPTTTDPREQGRGIAWVEKQEYFKRLDDYLQEAKKLGHNHERPLRATKYLLEKVFDVK